MDTRDITLSQSTIDYGHISFAGTDASFFPKDSFGDHGRKGGRGLPVVFDAGDFTFETDIRVMSGKRISPRKSFASYLKSVRARAGDLLHVTRVAEREYLVEHIRP